MIDLSEQLTRLIDAPDSVELEDVIHHSLRTDKPTAPWRRPLTIAAAVFIIAGLVLGVRTLLSRHEDSVRVTTPNTPTELDSYGAPGPCGDGSLSDTVRFEGPLAARTCAGVDERVSTEDEIVVRVLRDGAPRELNHLVIGSCDNGGSVGTGEISLADGTVGFLQYGSIQSEAEYVRFTVPESGLTYTAGTAKIGNVESTRFFAILLPGAQGRLDPVPLDSNGDPIPSLEPPRCIPTGDTTTVEESEALMARLIREQSEQLGIQVGDPCPAPDEDLGRVVRLFALVGGDPHTGDNCRVLGWMPFGEIPGVLPGYYSQDGTLLWNMIAERGSQPPDLYALLEAQAGGS